MVGVLRSCKAVALGLAVAVVSGAVRDSAEFDDASDGIEQDALTSEQMRLMHEKFDGDRDGKASLEEVMKFSTAMRRDIARKDIGAILEDLDLDKDGRLSLEELIKDMEQWGAADSEDPRDAAQRKDLETAKFRASDDNGDGLLTLAELPALFFPETKESVLALTARATLRAKDLDKDGQLTLKEFWEGDVFEGVSEDTPISAEEEADFKLLDVDGSGRLDITELTHWESGSFHTREAMRVLFDIADKDGDLHVTVRELDNAREKIAGSDAQYHLMEWAEHHEL